MPKHILLFCKPSEDLSAIAGDSEFERKYKLYGTLRLSSLQFYYLMAVYYGAPIEIIDRFQGFTEIQSESSQPPSFHGQPLPKWLEIPYERGDSFPVLTYFAAIMEAISEKEDQNTPFLYGLPIDWSDVECKRDIIVNVGIIKRILATDYWQAAVSTLNQVILEHSIILWSKTCLTEQSFDAVVMQTDMNMTDNFDHRLFEFAKRVYPQMQLIGYHPQADHPSLTELLEVHPASHGCFSQPLKLGSPFEVWEYPRLHPLDRLFEEIEIYELLEKLRQRQTGTITFRRTLMDNPAATEQEQSRPKLSRASNYHSGQANTKNKPKIS